MKTGDWMVAYGAEGVGQADEDPVDLLVNRISKKATLALDRALEGEKIGYRQWLVLSEIHETPGTTARTIAAHLGHDTGALSRIIDVLCERGLVQRARSPEDRRTVRLTTTAAGGESSIRCRRKVLGLREAWKLRLSTSEQVSIAAMMSRLTAAIDEHREVPR